MPKTAQDRMQRGPIAALLILFGLFLGSGPATANVAGVAAPAARTVVGRQGLAAALSHPASRSTLHDESSDGAGGPPVLAARPDVVTQALSIGQSDRTPAALPVLLPQPGARFYRARAPPAA